MKKPKSDYVIQTVSNALRLMEAFRGEEELGVTELSRRLSLHKNNVFRLLATLEEAGYVDQSDASDRYRLGVRCLELGQSFAGSRGLLQRARPVLEGLSAELGETSHVALLHDYDVVHLDGQLPDQLLFAGLRVGRRLPAHSTALGKSLLAFADDGLREAFDRDVIAGGRLQASSEATIEDRDKFFEHLRTVASDGFALDVEECQTGICCVAAPIHDGGGRLVGALSLSGPACRLTEVGLRERLAPALVAATDELSRQLGFGG